jgi:hypothetical protein
MRYGSKVKVLGPIWRSQTQALAGWKRKHGDSSKSSKTSPPHASPYRKELPLCIPFQNVNMIDVMEHVGSVSQLNMHSSKIIKVRLYG